MQKPFDLEERTLFFARSVLDLARRARTYPLASPLVDQLIRSAASVGANYREATEALSRKDFVHRLKIARKEAKETTYWLDLLTNLAPTETTLIMALRQESLELRNILSAIIKKAL